MTESEAPLSSPQNRCACFGGRPERAGRGPAPTVGCWVWKPGLVMVGLDAGGTPAAPTTSLFAIAGLETHNGGGVWIEMTIL